MEKYIYDNSNGLWYELHGDYYIPCLVLLDTEERPLGIWGRRHLNFIKEQRPKLYADLVLSCKLHNYLADIDAQVQVKLNMLMKEMAEKEGVTKQLKAQDQMALVRAMNSIRNRVEEIINMQIIFA